MSLTIAIQGDIASFHDIAAEVFFGTDTGRVCCDTFDETFNSLKTGKADYAVSAIENSLYGSINEVYDLLLRYDFTIIGEVYLRIEQCLIGLPGTSIADIKEVHSHPVALAQCEDYFENTIPHARLLESHDTAASVAYVKERNNPHIAAVASKEAAKLHKLEVLAPSIETNQQNYTRFLILSKTKQASKSNNKTSLVIHTAHTPGSLYEALGAFAKYHINLSKLQSRPIIGSEWQYMFYVDAEIGDTHSEFKEVEKMLDAQGCEVQILGSYKNGRTSV